MHGFEPRFYRDHMGEHRFRSFIIKYKDSDLWIGVDDESYDENMPEFAKQQLLLLRNELETYILKQPLFATSFAPVQVIDDAPEIALQMGEAGFLSQTGPMASVAGAFSEFIGKAIQKKFRVNELVVENGGDIYMILQKNLTLSVYAGDSMLSGKIGVEIPAIETPVGICTSAGTVGPSISFGKADAVTVACKNTLLADAFATAIGNRIVSSSDIDMELSKVNQQPEILSLLIICDGKVGVKGKFQLRMIAPKP